MTISCDHYKGSVDHWLHFVNFWSERPVFSASLAPEVNCRPESHWTIKQRRGIFKNLPFPHPTPPSVSPHLSTCPLPRPTWAPGCTVEKKQQRRLNLQFRQEAASCVFCRAQEQHFRASIPQHPCFTPTKIVLKLKRKKEKKKKFCSGMSHIRPTA